jgi:hypothetical protein
VRPSLDPAVKHHITYCKLNLKIPPPPKFVRKIYHYGRAQKDSIAKAIDSFPWATELNKFTNPTQQVCLLNKTILNIMKNFIPNEDKVIRPKDPPWFTKDIRSRLKKHNRIYKKYKSNGFKDEDKISVDTSKSEIINIILDSKEKYLISQGSRLADPSTGSKTYWKILNTFLNKIKVPRIPPIFHDGDFITDCKEKATKFNDYFALQCTPFVTDSVLPPLTYLTNNRFLHLYISNDDVNNILKVLKLNKAHGPDEISVNMIKLCGESICSPLRIIFQNIIKTGIFPDQWKEANVTAVHKKRTNRLSQTTDPYHFFPYLPKYLRE